MVNNNDISGLSFEQAMEQLEKIVQKLETGNVELAQSINIYETGELLKKHCSDLLKKAELKIEKIKLNDNNEYENVTSLEESAKLYVKKDDLPF